MTFRVVPPPTEEHGQRAAAELRTHIVSIPGPVVVVSDLRAARTFSPQTTERFVALMRSDNAKIERTAMLVGNDSPTLGLQIARLIKEAGHPGRRAFHDAHELSEWLHEVLGADEQSALASFLAQGA